MAVSLRTVVVPSSIKKKGYEALRCDPNLSVYYADTSEVWSEITFAFGDKYDELVLMTELNR